MRAPPTARVRDSSCGLERSPKPGRGFLMRLQKNLLAALCVAIGILLVGAGCSNEEVPVTVEVTREVQTTVEVPATVEVTREVQATVEVTREVPVTVQIEAPSPVEVEREVTRVVEVPVTVEVTREIPATVEVTREVQATVEVTRQVPVTVEIEVTRQVPATIEVTREVVVTATPTATPTPFPTPEVDELWNTADTPSSYDDFFRNNEEYLNQGVKWSGRIIQVIEDGENYQFRVDVGSSDIVYLHGYSGKRFLENDTIEFVGISRGLISYESIFGGQVTIPGIRVADLMLLEIPPTPTPTIMPTAVPEPGYVRSNPVPFGSDTSPVVDDTAIYVLNVTRGWDQHKQISLWNDDPEDGYEYVLISVQIDNLGDPNSSKSFSEYRFEVIGDLGVVYSGAPVVIENELGGEIYGGSTLRGNLIFEVPSDEEGLVLKYNTPCYDCPDLYFSLSTQ